MDQCQPEDRRPIQRHDKNIYYTLDGIRFIASLVVVSIHTPFLGTNVFKHGYLAVDLFFTLSGFVVANAYENKILSGMSIPEFMSIRAIRLYPLYLIGIIIGLTVYHINFPSATWLAVYHLSLSLLFIPNPENLSELYPLDTPAWSLFFELFINFVYIRVFDFLNWKRISVLLFMCAMALLTASFLSQNINYGWKLKSLPAGFVRVFCSFYIGVLMYRMKILLDKYMPIKICSNLLSFVVLAIVYSILCYNPTGVLVFAFDPFVVLFAIPLFVLLGSFVHPTGAVLQIFRLGGLISYAAYIVHQPLGLILRQADSKYPALSLGERAPIAGLSMIILILIISFILSEMYDKPMRKWLRRLQNRFMNWLHGGSRQLANHHPDS